MRGAVLSKLGEVNCRKTDVNLKRTVENSMKLGYAFEIAITVQDLGRSLQF